MSILTLFKTKNALGAALLVSGCCIGAGMIGLPVVSALTGFVPSTIAMGICYLFTTVTGLLLLEATLWFDEKINLASIVEHTLGKFSKSVTMILFLFLFYCLFIAYLDGGGILFADMLSIIFHHPVSKEVGILTCLMVVGMITYTGTKNVDYINRSLLIGLAITYFVLLAIGLPSATEKNLAFADYSAALATIPILLICFGYHNLIPSLTYYLKKNVNALRYTIIIGNLIPFIIYFLWNLVILGMLSPTHTSSNEVGMVTELLQSMSPSIPVIVLVKAFSFFAIFTSFLPSALSFIDFLKDGIKHSFLAKTENKYILYLVVFIPPLICSLFYPHIFLQALSFAGGFIDVLLFGVLPATVILVGRNIQKMKGPYQIIGGNLTPGIILLFSLLILFLKLC